MNYTFQRDIRIFKGSHLIAVRIDGKNYTSEDTNIPLEAKMIIRRVQAGEEPYKILQEIKGQAHAVGSGGTSPRQTYWSGARKIQKPFFENFSMIVIVGLVLILLFQMLLLLKDCG